MTFFEVRFFWKNMENVIKHRNIKFVTTEIRRNSLVSKQNYYTTKFFMKYSLAIEIKEKCRYTYAFRTFNTRIK